MIRSNRLLDVDKLNASIQGQRFRRRIADMLRIGRQGLTDLVQVKVYMDFHSIDFKVDALDYFSQMFTKFTNVPVGGEAVIIDRMMEALVRYSEKWQTGEGSMMLYCILNVSKVYMQVFSMDAHGGGDYIELPK